MTIKKLQYMPYAQAHVEQYDNGDRFLVSYCTTVVSIDKDGWLECYGTYSRTTIRHISAFMREYGHGRDYYTAKSAYLHDYAINIYTGETKEKDWP